MNEWDEREEMLFEAALHLPPEQRAEFLERNCADDIELRRHVEGLIGAFERGPGLLKEPAVSAPAKTVILSLTATEEPGDKIGRYKLLQRIGEGGCGIVYRAEQAEPVRRQVALKIIKLGMDTKQVVARFEAERQALALMDHPNIARVFDAGATDTGRPFFVMELVRGIKITEYSDQNQLTTTERLELFIQVCLAVQHAHQKGIIHRDLKPSNILVTQQDGVAVPKVIDFGIAKATTDQRLTDQTLFTAFEQFMGTPAYMSPEQAQLSGLDIDTRTDIYSLGVLLYELLTGKTPFDAKELMAAGLDEMRRTIREDEPIRPSTRLTQELVAADRSKSDIQNLKSEIDGASSRRQFRLKETVALLRGDLDWIVMKCLEKDRARRYVTAHGLAADLRCHLSNEPVAARPPSAAYRFEKLVRRNKLAFAAATTIIATLLLGVSVSTWQAIRAKRESARARENETRAREESELAQRQERRANASLYAANMRLAQFAWEQNAAGQVRQLLEETEDHPNRSFEWFYWQRQTHLQLETLRGHRELVLAVAASPHGRWIVTGSQDGTAKVWESASGKPPRTLGGHRGAVSSVAFSPDSQRVVTGSWDHTAMVWEMDSGKLVQVLKGHTGEVFSAAFSPGGERVVTGSHDNTAKVWDALTGQEQLVLRGHAHRVWSATFSADGCWIVTGSHDRTAKVWDATTGEERRTFREHSGPIYSVAVSPHGERVATASEDLTARVWHLATCRNLFPPLKGHRRPISSVAFSRDGRTLATGSFDQTVKVWDPASGTEWFTVRGHGSPISSVAFSADGQRLITGGGSVGVTPTAANVEPGMGDGTAKVWAASGDQEVLTLRGHTDKVMAVAFSPESQRIVTGSFDKTATVWDSSSGKALFTLRGHDEVRAVAFSPDGQRIVTGHFDGIARVWSATGDRVLAELKGHNDKILTVSFSPDGQRIVTGSADGSARLWSAVDGKRLAVLAGDGGWIFSVAFSPDGRWVATGSNDGRTGIWDVATTNRLHVLTAHDWGVGGVAFSPDGQRIVTGCGNGMARIWDTRTGEELLALAGHTFEIHSVAFSPDGQRVVTAGKDRAAKVWDASGGLELLTLTGHTDVIWAVAFSPDGQRIVTGSWDGTAKVWRAATPKEVLRWRAEEPSRKQLAAAARQDAALRRQDPGAIKRRTDL